jgi:hypothetical protein
MIRTGDSYLGVEGEDTEFCGLIYPDGEALTKHLVERLQGQAFYQAEKWLQTVQIMDAYNWPRRGAIDAGAWVGGWTRAMANRFERVASFEVNSD